MDISRGKGFFAILALKPGGGVTGPPPGVAVSVLRYFCEANMRKDR